MKQYWNKLFEHNFADLVYDFAYFFVAKSLFFWFNCLCNFHVGILSNKEAILWRCTSKELFLVNSSKNISKKRVIKLATMLKMCCYKCFTKNMVKIYRTAILTNFFWCMRSKSQWSTHPVVFFNPLMLVVTKDIHIYLNKPASLKWSIVIRNR